MNCQIYSCRRRWGRPCCAECSDTECEDRCLNSPDRCNCSTARRGHCGSQPKYDREEIRRLRSEGRRIMEIAAIVGCSASTVSNALGKRR